MENSMALVLIHGPMGRNMLETMIWTKGLVLVPWSIQMGQSFLASGQMECTRNLGKIQIL